jgi:hypothetical protein
LLNAETAIKDWNSNLAIHTFLGKSKIFKYSLTYSFLFALYGLLAFALYAPFRTNIFSMDDPSLIQFLEDESLSSVDQIFSTGSNRWRPVANFAYLLAFKIGGENYQYWLSINIILLALAATLLAGLVFQISKIRLFALLAPLLVVTSRFVTYQVVTATGLMESLVTLLVVAYLFALYHVIRKPATTSIIILFCFTFLLILAHERYQLLCLASSLSVIFFQKSKVSRFVWAAIMFVPVIFLVVIKVYVLQIPLFVGTGSATSLGFSLDGTIVHLTEAISNLGGLVIGPSYLVAIPWFEMSPVLQLISILTFIVSSFIFIYAFYSFSVSLVSQAFRWSYICLSILVFLSLLLPVLVTIRLEQRWLTTPYIALIVISSFAWRIKARQKFTNSRLLFTSGILILAFSIILNLGVSNHSQGYFFLEHSSRGKQMLAVLSPMLLKAEGQDCKLTILDTSGSIDFETYVVGILEANTEFTSENIAVVSSESDNLIPCDFGSIAFDPKVGFSSEISK